MPFLADNADITSAPTSPVLGPTLNLFLVLMFKSQVSGSADTRPKMQRENSRYTKLGLKPINRTYQKDLNRNRRVLKQGTYAVRSYILSSIANLFGGDHYQLVLHHCSKLLKILRLGATKRIPKKMTHLLDHQCAQLYMVTS